MPYWISNECSGKTLGLGLGLLEIDVASGFVGYHSIYIYIYRNYHKCKGRTLVFKVWVILSSSLGYTYLTVELDALTVVSFLSTINVHSGLITEMDDCICLLSIRKQIGAPW